MAYESEQRVETVVWPARAAWWLLPVWSAFGGVWAFSRTSLTESPATIAIAVVLVVAGWQPFWHIATQTAWAGPLSRWKTWTQSMSMPPWPYLEPGTPGASLHQRVCQARSWWHEVGRAALIQPLSRGFLAVAISLLLGAALGREALLLSLCFTALTELAALWHEGRGRTGAMWSGLTLVGLPWLLGASLHGEGVRGVVSALVLTLVAGIFTQTSWWSIFGPVLGAAFLVRQGHAYAAGWLLLASLPALLVLVQRPEEEAHRSVAGVSLLGMIAIVAVVL